MPLIYKSDTHWVQVRPLPGRVMKEAISVTKCSRCKLPSIVHQPYSGQHLCGRHLSDSVRRRTSRELRRQLSLPKDARKENGSPFVVLVAVSGGKDSAVLLSMIKDIIGSRRDIRIVAGCVDEGIDGYRSPSLECARDLSEELGVDFVTLSYEEMGYDRMDKVVSKIPGMGELHDEASGMMPCSFCGVFRRQSLNSLADKVGADVMALGHNLDDMAQSILMNLQKGEIERSVRLAPHTSAPIEGMVPRIVPLRWIPEQEIHAFAIFNSLPIHHGDCPHAPGAQRQQSRAIVAQLESHTPGARHGLLHSLDQIREIHREVHPNPNSKIGSCSICGEPTSRPVCQSCTMKKWLSEVP